jgi:hypothetical protein
VGIVLLLARRLAGLLIAFALVTGLPLAAARAGCVCAHGHQHGKAAAAAPHRCTAACTAETCPMHRNGGSSARTDAPRTTGASDAMRCGCAGEAQALIGQASIAGVLPAVVAVDAPPLARVTLPSMAASPLGLETTPPAPPPRA